MVALGILVPSVSVRIAAVQQRKLPFEGAFFVERALRALPLTLPLPKPLPRGGAPPQKRRVRLRLMNKLHAPEGTSAGRDFRDFGLPGVLAFPGQDHFGRFWSWRARNFSGQDHFARFWSWLGRHAPFYPRPGGQRQGHWALSRSPGALSAAGPLPCRGPAVPCLYRFS